MIARAFICFFHVFVWSKIQLYFSLRDYIKKKKWETGMYVLIIEDEKRLAATLADLLEISGYETAISNNGKEGLEFARTGIYDAVILDVMLPELNGFQVLERLRHEKVSVPIVMLTAKGGVEDRIRGLNAGADYYLPKPFENRELLACLRAVMRRTQELDRDELRFGDLVLLIGNSQLCCEERKVTLSAKELALLQLLLQNTSQYIQKERILQKVWGYDADVGMNNVEAYISFLRKKLVLLKSKVRLTVVRNIGYKLEIES